nr:hypothetical protein Iba_chr11dCG9040 [Ipomoea batatas]
METSEGEGGGTVSDCGGAMSGGRETAAVDGGSCGWSEIWEEGAMVEGRRSLLRCGRRRSHDGGGRRSSYCGGGNCYWWWMVEGCYGVDGGAVRVAEMR